MKGVLIGLGVVVLLVLIVGGSFMGSRNELVTERESYKAQWQQVDVALQRRLDLIPNLVETVKGFAKQELAVMTAVTDARAAMMGATNPARALGASRRSALPRHRGAAPKGAAPEATTPLHRSIPED